MRWHKLSFASAVLVATHACGPAPDVGDATSMFRGGPAHQGSYAAADVSGLVGVRWRFQTEGAVRGSPTVADGTLYVGSSSGLMYALTAHDGETVWSFDAGSPISSSAAVAGEKVYFGDRRGVLHAVRAADGSESWRFETGPEMPLPWGNEGWDYFTSSPTVVDGMVLFGSGDGNLYAVDAVTGAEKWRYATDGRIRSSPAVADGVVYVGSMDGRLHAIDLETGQSLWRFEAEGYSLDSGEFGFDRRSIQSSPSVADGRVFFGSRDGFLYAVDAASGEQVWRFDHEVSWCNTSPAVAEGVVYAGTSDGLFVHAVDAATGEELWRSTTDARVFASPSLAGGTLVVGDHGGDVLALDRGTGELRWRFRTGEAIQSSAVVVGDVVYVGSDDGAVYALQATGEAGTRRAVYWDEDSPSFYQGHEALRDELSGAGYEVLDSAQLESFMRRQLEGGAPSVIVFAKDHVPAAGEDRVPSDAVLMRRYVEAGGAVVWVGYPPYFIELDAETGAFISADLERTSAVLGVDHSSASSDEYPTHPTFTGRRTGVGAWTVDAFGLPADQVTTALSLDVRGRATSWVESYGNGGAFVRAWGRPVPMPDPAVVRRLADQFPAGSANR